MEPTTQLRDTPTGHTPRGDTGGRTLTEVSTVAELSALIEATASQVGTCSDVELVDLITHLETLKNQCCALQAHAALALEDIRLQDATTARQREAAHRSVISEVALARRESPHRARTLLGLATALHTELPHTLAHLQAGRISEYRATLVARETACLEVPERLAADHALAAQLPTWSNREVAAHARHVAYTLDPHSVVAHTQRAESERRVSIRPAPACMAIVTALLPVTQGVAVHAALLRAAESARATGDERGRGQVMADTLVTRITGQSAPPAVPLEVQLVITDDTLLAGGNTPARLNGFGPIPPDIARRLLTHTEPSTGTGTGSGSGDTPGTGTGAGTEASSDPDRDPDGELDEETHHWIRRLYTHPENGQLINMESTRRLFPTGLRRFITTRDDNTCRTPWCGAPIAHIDHITPARNGGPTTAHNAQGLCIHCNQAKEAPHWHADPEPDGTITTTTPTGHTHNTHPPPLPHDPPTITHADTDTDTDTSDTSKDTADSNKPNRPAPRSRAPAA